MSESTAYNSSDIAIIGMSGRFPQAYSPEKLWERLSKSENCISSFSLEELKLEGVEEEVRRKPNYVRTEPVLDYIAYLDAPFSEITPQKAELMDPQHRLR